MAKYTLLKDYKRLGFDLKAGQEIEADNVADIALLTANGYIAEPLERKEKKATDKKA